MFIKNTNGKDKKIVRKCKDFLQSHNKNNFTFL